MAKRKNIKITDVVTNSVTRDLVDAYTRLGRAAMYHAYGKRGFKHRTRNLRDSYGCAVYVGGKLVEESKRYVGGVFSRDVDPKTLKTGRETLNDWLNNHRFGSKSDDIVLIVIAAMYYAGILENKRGEKTLDKIQVISLARTYIDKHWHEVTQKVYAKHGLATIKPKARVIKGETLKKDE